IATNFARAGTLIYCLAGGLAIFLLNRHKSIVDPEGWSWLEPRIWLSAMIFLLIQYLLQGLFAWSAPSYNPVKLYDALKSWKKKRLLKKRLGDEMIKSP